MNRFTITACMKHLMVVIGCVHMACGPHGALQVVAWAGMLANYSLENGVARGVVDTFSGDRPCGMCLKIAEMRGDGDSSPDAPNPERRNLSASMTQDWQAARGTRLSPPPGRALGANSQRPPASIRRASRYPVGPDTPPPRFA